MVEGCLYRYGLNTTKECLKDLLHNTIYYTKGDFLFLDYLFVRCSEFISLANQRLLQ